MTKLQFLPFTLTSIFSFGFWNLELIWLLVLGAWNLPE